MSLQGRTIALAEGRHLEELAQMLEKEGAVAWRCPMLSILDHPDKAPIASWLRNLAAGKFTHVVLLTGEGLRRLINFAEREQLDRTAIVAALGRTELITRGPKPVRALKELNLTPTKVAVTPTTEGVIATLKQSTLHDARVGVQLYSDSNPPLTDYLASAGASVFPVVPYIYAPAADGKRVAELIQKMANGDVDVLVFTSSPQVDRVFELASAMGLGDLLTQGLARVKIAAVGPVVKEKLLEKNARADIMPEQGFVMKNLVQHMKRAMGG
jgi:uroporphyrinogen-III synthase